MYMFVYLPLCGLVILQPSAADQEIMKTQTHGASLLHKQQNIRLHLMVKMHTEVLD